MFLTGRDDEGSDRAAGPGGSAAAYPVTVRSKHGSATIAERPRRVVTLDNQSTDDALALGVLPVGMAKVTYVPGGVQTWTKTALRGRKTPPLINTDNGIPYERVAALRPDLILATHGFALDDRRVYDRVTRIAPTVHFTWGSLVDGWQQSMRRVGRASGRRTARGGSSPQRSATWRPCAGARRPSRARP